MATEIAYITLKAGANPRDSSDPSAEVWKSTIDEVSQQDGFQNCYYGLGVENPNLMQLVIDWDTVEHHIKFTKSAGYGAFVKRIGSIVDPEVPLRLYHVHWDTHPPTIATSAPVTELVIFHLSGTTSDAERKKYEEGAAKFKAALEKDAAGFKGIVGGFAVEELEHKGESGTAFVSLLGWDSVKAHMDYRETQSFKDTIPLIKTSAVRGAEMHHVKFDQLAN